MVALIQPNTHLQPHGHQQGRVLTDRPALVGLPTNTSDLDDVAQGNHVPVSGWISSLDRRVLTVLGGIVACFVMLSLVQGGPPSAAELDAASVAASAPAQVQLGETSVIAEPGDTYWGIAEGLVPSSEVRNVVEQLVARNGGADLLVGQVVVIPADLG